MAVKKLKGYYINIENGFFVRKILQKSIEKDIKEYNHDFSSHLPGLGFFEIDLRFSLELV